MRMYNLRPRPSNYESTKKQASTKAFTKKQGYKQNIAIPKTNSSSTNASCSLSGMVANNSETFISMQCNGSLSCNSSTSHHSFNLNVGNHLNETYFHPIALDIEGTILYAYLSYSTSNQGNSKLLDVPGKKKIAALNMHDLCSFSSTYESHFNSLSSYSIHSTQNTSTFHSDRNNNFEKRQLHNSSIAININHQRQENQSKKGNVVKDITIVNRQLILQERLYNAIIKDSEILKRINKGCKPRFRTVPKTDSILGFNYKKSNLKIDVGRIIKQLYPNTEWWHEISSSTNIKKPPKLTILGNVSISNVCLENQAIDTNLQESSDYQSDSGISSDYYTTEVESVREAPVIQSPFVEYKAKTRPPVYLHPGRDGDFSVVIDTLGPDYYPVVITPNESKFKQPHKVPPKANSLNTIIERRVTRSMTKKSSPITTISNSNENQFTRPVKVVVEQITEGVLVDCTSWPISKRNQLRQLDGCCDDTSEDNAPQVRNICSDANVIRTSEYANVEQFPDTTNLTQEKVKEDYVASFRKLPNDVLSKHLEKTSRECNIPQMDGTGDSSSDEDSTPKRKARPSKTPSSTEKSISKATRELNFGLNQTVIKEKIECRLRSKAGSRLDKHVIPLSQVKQQILLRRSLMSSLPVLPTHNVKEQEAKKPGGNSQIANIEMQSSLNDSSAITNDLPVLLENMEDSNQSHGLFPLDDALVVRQVDTDVEDACSTVSSSVERLITPYQLNQPPDYYNYSQDDLFEGTLKERTMNLNTEKAVLCVEKTTNQTKADQYDKHKGMIVQAGPSNHPSSFESVVFYALPEENESKLLQPKQSISIFDLTFHLDVCDSDLNESAMKDHQISFITPKFKPPSVQLITETMSTYNIPDHRYQDPFYSDAKHLSGTVDVGFNTLRILARHQYEEFRSSFNSLLQYQRAKASSLGVTNQKELKTLKLSYCSIKPVFVTPAIKPPSVKDVKLWLLKKKQTLFMKNQRKSDVSDGSEDMNPTCKEVQDYESNDMLGLTISERMEGCTTSPTVNKAKWENSHAISGVSLNNTHGFKMTLENLQEARSLDIYQYITSLVLELHADSRGDKLPDPQIDPVQIVFFALANDVPDKTPSTSGMNISDMSSGTPRIPNAAEHFLKGFICVSPVGDILAGTGIAQDKFIFTVPDELHLFNKLLELYHTWNPDILMGYEIEHSSWGYLIERGYVLGLNMPSLLSRIKDDDKRKQPHMTPEERDPQEEHSHLKITGRIVLDLWRILKHEIALQSYTFENLAYHVLHERVPHYSPKELTRWWNHKSRKFKHRTVNYYLYRVEGAFRLIDHYDLIGRTSELARLFGILFYEVLSRGSQFRVESMMLRLAKPYKYVPVSPSVQQRAHMKAPEFLPLILEPESKFYIDPVIVLDFQSLYPSIIIAYNYCFSTCLGRVEHLGTDEKFEFGAYELEVARKLVAKYLKANLLTISPCGVAFVKDAVRPGIVPRMLREILDTRLMVKKSMKNHKGNKTLQKVLHSRQLGLKLIANVTYGYTAANFSGRMPACELADSVVSKGRETLQRAINMVEKHSSWGARVVYGDTDSMFVMCKGKSKEEAFRIGEEIADAVTNANPSPVKLKLEKVYQPCILQTKKRYVGYMYESTEQKFPEFEAKGIETVRRDGCPAASKMLEKCLRLLFDHRDVSQVRNYVLKQFHKILTGRVSIQDLTFAKEYRGKEGYRPAACVPALELSRRWMSTDKRKEPRCGERVPYVIVNGPPGLPLIKLVKSPHDLLEESSLRPNALYYITKAIIPPINRCFKLIGADLFNWFNEMPRKHVQHLHIGSPSKGPKSTISQYFATAACASCGLQTKDGICSMCLTNPQSAIVSLQMKILNWERNYYTCRKVCESCCSRTTDLACNSLDCPVLYRIKQTAHDLQQVDFVRSVLKNFPELF